MHILQGMPFCKTGQLTFSVSDLSRVGCTSGYPANSSQETFTSSLLCHAFWHGNISRRASRGCLKSCYPLRSKFSDQIYNATAGLELGRRFSALRMKANALPVWRGTTIMWTLWNLSWEGRLLPCRNTPLNSFRLPLSWRSASQ